MIISWIFITYRFKSLPQRTEVNGIGAAEMHILVNSAMVTLNSPRYVKDSSESH